MAPMKKPPIDLAIDAVGSLTELARRLGRDPQVLVNWRKRGIPVEEVPAVEAATVARDEKDRPMAGAQPKVARHQLRPDKPHLFPPAPAGAVQREAIAAGTR
jgi:DNA-binding transcriptional regulator YdaS (Cro superfamily)